ncbi:hypothetical protein CBL_03466 [Carabus blaptoides fortunei]
MPQRGPWNLPSPKRTMSEDINTSLETAAAHKAGAPKIIVVRKNLSSGGQAPMPKRRSIPNSRHETNTCSLFLEVIVNEMYNTAANILQYFIIRLNLSSSLYLDWNYGPNTMFVGKTLKHMCAKWSKLAVKLALNEHLNRAHVLLKE